MSKKPGFESILIEDLHDLDQSYRSHTPPIYPTSTFVYPSAEKAQDVFQGKGDAFIYGRWHNPVTDAVEKKLARLEAYDLDQEAHAHLFSTGMAGISAIIEATCASGDRIITQGNLYGATDELIHFAAHQMKMDVCYTDLHDLEAIQVLLKEKKTSLIYIESPSNPTLNAYDIKALSELAQQHGAKVAVDNTFASSFLQRPLSLGADIVLHSTTKFLNGHGTTLGGVVISLDEEWVNGPLRKQRVLKGATMSPFDAWLLNNGLKTLALRMRKHCANTREVVDFLVKHKAVAKVNYLGLSDHPDHEIAKKQMSDYGGVISFELKGGLDAGMKMMRSIEMLTLTATLGTPDTLIQHPASMTHSKVAPEQRRKFGITDGLIRMAIGLEDIEDILQDIQRSLKDLA